MATPSITVKPVEIVKPARKTRTRVPTDETKAERFRRLANHRVARVIKLLGSVGALGNRTQYECTQAQCDAICGAIAKSFTAMKVRLEGTKPEDNEFSL